MEQFINGQPAAAGAAPAGGDRVITLVARGGEDKTLPGMAEILKIRSRGEEGTRFESHDGFDYITVLAPSPADPEAPLRRVEMYLDETHLLLVYEKMPAMDKMLDFMHEPRGGEELTPPLALCLFFSILTRTDTAALEDMEEGIANLEDTMMGPDVPDDSVERIGQLRRRLLGLKRYYEALFDLLEDMEENANGLMGKEALRLVHLQTNRADRLSRAVLNLRDYVTQVREAYQNQLDISLNQTMKVFTVITAVFLPLSLIAGWYGMNLMMPEYSQPWAYPVVIAVSALVAGTCLWYFKKKKWF